MEHERVRDGLLAAGLLAVLLSMLRVNGDLGVLRNPRAAGMGVGAALFAEFAFLSYPDRLLSLWERPAVNRGSTLGLLGGALLARRRPRLLAAGIWGLATYFALLVGLLLRRNGDEKAADGQS